MAALFTAWVAMSGLAVGANDALEKALRDHGFAVLGEHRAPDLYEGYYELKDGGSPVLVTSDAMLSLWYEAHRHIVWDLEAARLLPLSRQMLEDLAPHAAVGPASERTALWVALALAGCEQAPPADVAGAVSAQVAKIQAASDIETYPGDDYTQYKPRGPYDRSEATRRYFRLSKWLGRHLIPLVGEDASPETLRRAAWWVDVLRRDATAQAAWNDLAAARRYLAGPFNGISVDELALALTRVLGPDWTVASIDTAAAARLTAELRQPGYTVAAVESRPTVPGTWPSRAFALLPEHGLPDSRLLQRAINSGQQPSGLLVASALGLPHAAELAGQALPELEPDGSLYGQWLHTLAGLGDLDPRSPAFMRSTPWQDKTVGTALASWAQLRHNYVLYGAQSYQSIGVGEAQRGFVEPLPEFWRRYRAMVERFRERVEALGAGPQAAQMLSLLAGKAAELARFSELELAGRPLPDGGAVLQDFAEFIEQLPFDRPHTVVDVATTDSGVLYAGVGEFEQIVVRFPAPANAANKRPLDARGYVASYYEFWGPAGERMDDTQWDSLLQSALARPQRPEWTASFRLPAPNEAAAPDARLARAEELGLTGHFDQAMALFGTLRSEGRGTALEAQAAYTQAELLQRVGRWAEAARALMDCCGMYGCEASGWARGGLRLLGAAARQARETAGAQQWLAAELTATEPTAGLTPDADRARQDRRLRALLDPARARLNPPGAAHAVVECRGSRLWPAARLLAAAGDLSGPSSVTEMAPPQALAPETAVALSEVERDFRGSEIGERAAAWLLAGMAQTAPADAFRRIEPYLTGARTNEPYPDAAALVAACLDPGTTSTHHERPAHDTWAWAGCAVLSGLYRAAEFELYLRAADHLDADRSHAAQIRFVRYFWQHDPEALKLFALAGVEWAVSHHWPAADGQARRERLLELVRRFPRSLLAPLALDALRWDEAVREDATAHLLRDYPTSRPAVLIQAEQARKAGEYERAVRLCRRAAAMRSPWRGPGRDDDPEAEEPDLLWCARQYHEVAQRIAPLLRLPESAVEAALDQAARGGSEAEKAQLARWKQLAGDRSDELVKALGGELGTGPTLEDLLRPVPARTPSMGLDVAARLVDAGPGPDYDEAERVVEAAAVSDEGGSTPSQRRAYVGSLARQWQGRPAAALLRCALGESLLRRRWTEQAEEVCAPVADAPGRFAARARTVVQRARAFREGLHRELPPRWRTTALSGRDHGHSSVRTMAADGGLVVCGGTLLSGECGLVALDATSGAIRWRAACGDVLAMRVDEGLVYALLADRLVALDAADGHERWHGTFADRSLPMAGWIGRQDDVVLAANLHGIHAYEPASGAERWSRPIYYDGAPRLAAGVLVVRDQPDGLSPRTLRGFSPADGHQLWRTTLPALPPAGPRSSPPSLSGPFALADGSVVCVYSGWPQSTLVRLRASDGAVQGGLVPPTTGWVDQTRARVHGNSLLTDDARAIDGRTGALLWTLPGGASQTRLAASGSDFWVSMGPQVGLLDAADGHLRGVGWLGQAERPESWEHGTASAMAVTAEEICVLTGGGEVMAFRTGG